MNEVPVPLGRVVAEPLALFVHASWLVYEASVDVEPAAIASVSVYVVPEVTAVDPVVALTATPDVVAEATVLAPLLMATTNWSVLMIRPATDLTSVRAGTGAFVMEHEMTSPAKGVMEKGASEPVGKTVEDPDAALVQLIVPTY